VLGLIVLGWYVGYVQGQGAVEARFQQGVSAQQQRAQQGPPSERFEGMGEGIGPTGQGGGGQGSTDGAANPTQRDPRQAGLNYYVLVTWPESDAREIARFFARQGVATHLQMLNNGKAQVWVVAKGFERGQTGSEPAKAFRQRLKDLGRQFARETNWPTSAVTRPQLYKYKPQSAG
jgi:hypothetical protein